MVQNEINNMSFLTADNKSKMAKVGALLWEVALAGKEGTPKGFLPAPSSSSRLPCPGHIPCSPHSFVPSHLAFPSSYPHYPRSPSPLPLYVSELPSTGFNLKDKPTHPESRSGNALPGDACPVGRELGLGQLGIRSGVL